MDEFFDKWNLLSQDENDDATEENEEGPSGLEDDKDEDEELYSPAEDDSSPEEV